MKARCMTVCWTCYVSKKALLFVESEYRQSTCKMLWSELLKYYDKIEPKRPRSITEMRNKIIPEVQTYILQETRNLGEATKIIGKRYTLKHPSKWTAYYKSPYVNTNYIGVVEEDIFNRLCYDLALHVETGINFLRMEASEILAFVATDSERVYCADMPPHLPIAYGMKGPSLPMKVM